MDLRPRMIVWASVPDRNGHLKDRPVIILSAPPKESLSLSCCACATRDLKPRPDTYLRLPWDREGKSMTGLTKPCFAVKSWGVAVARDQVRRISGEVPGIWEKLTKRIDQE